MKTNIADEIVEELIPELLESLKVGAMWMSEFAWFRKTGEKELTLKIRIYRHSLDTDKCLEKVKEILKSMGWIYIVSTDTKNVGVVSR